MAMQAGNSMGPYSPHVVGSAFAQQYYKVLNGSPEHVHKFYHDESILGRPDSNGAMTYVTTTHVYFIQVVEIYMYVHKFYHDESILGRSDSNGAMTYVTTTHAINEEIVSTDLSRCLIELENVDTQPSHVGGMLILVTGSITTLDTVKHRFTQSFFLAPQENGGYFVLNDMLRYILEMPSAEANESLANHVDGISQIASFPAEPETYVKEGTDPELPSGENILVNDEVINPSAETSPDNAEVMTPSAENMSVKEKVIDPSAENISVKEKVINPAAENISVKEKVINTSAENISVKRNVTNPSANDHAQTKNDVETSVKVVSVNAEKIPEAAPAPPASAQKDVNKKTYASIVKDMKDNPLPPPIANPKSKPKPTVKRTENVETSASIDVKLIHGADTAPPNGKNVSNDVGYSIFVKNLPSNATVEMVEGEFKKFGAIKSGGIQVRHHQLDHFCYGFVEFETQQSMHAAIEASPIHVGSKQSYVEEKRTPRRVVNGVMTHSYNNGNIRGNRIQPGRGGYRDQGAGFMNNGNYPDGDNFRGKGAEFGNNNNYRDGDNFRGQGGGFRNYRDGDSFSGQGGGFRNYRDGDNFGVQGAGFRSNNNYRDGDNFRGRGAGFVSNGNMRNEVRNQDEYSGRGRGPQGNGYHQNGSGYHQNGNGYRQDGNGYHQSRPLYIENGNGRSARVNGPKQIPVAA